ncbi:O-methyltransferase [Winogradskyella alexanderae]|uniref:Class I SAM-dependent methyltransferase n=1 Tax=Winogradskyella alexanderae TaxID=2877123 RepID=A0ABS7XRE2_9FLAO|nr:class I SAM-dependent methyltransferase [Winogradskyella alexanderae]MCA0131993.1 class I SAM-dependent methyltransferase [Winogradskyella alexanderae]
MYSIRSYLKFLKASKNQHGVHSPFIYNFVTKCLYDKTKYQEYQLIKAYRKSLLKNNNRITVTDFGSGSRYFRTNRRKIGAIAANSGTPLKKSKLLFRVVNYFKTQNILELGTSLGIATQAMATSKFVEKITSIEGCKNTFEFTKKSLSNCNKIELINNQFDSYIPKIKASIFDLIYFDGHHDKDATISYFEALLSRAKNDSLFIFDDIYWSQGMTEAWNHIKAHNSVTVTVDIFHFGFVFFRKEQTKEHFKIRV